MNWYNFIFSEKKSVQLQRHLVFWLLWWVYFTASSFHYEQTGLQNLKFEPWSVPFFIKSILLLSIHITACYYFIRYIMPKYLFKAKYMAMAIQIGILSLLIILASSYLHKNVFPFINSIFTYEPVIDNRNIWWTSLTSGILSAPKVISAAAAIILLKRWYLKQKEKERLEKEKLLTELQLLKAQIHPEFLFSSLDNIYLLTQKKNIDKASVLLLKLADILSYILYESDNKMVPLEKEIKVIKDYLVLEKTRMGDKLELDVAIKGDADAKMITPLLLFPIIENSFLYFGNKNLEANWMNLEFQIDNTVLMMKVICGKATEASLEPSNDNTIASSIKRLDFFYPDKYELKTTVEPEVMMTYLKIELDEPGNDNINSIYNTEQIAYASA
jgi:sensor histidine kinase YesM